MLPATFVKGYLRFLLRYRAPVAVVLMASTLVFTWYSPSIFTNFFDLYPPRHPYIQLYTQYRSMFGTANTLLMVVEVKDGTIFDDPATIQKVDRITVELLHEIPGVNGEQVLSITHPKLKTTLTAGSGIKTVPLTYPRLPEDRQDLAFFKQKVYATEGVKGFFVSEDDSATLITAGFWEEYFDLIGMWRRIQEIVHREEDENHRIYVTGIPILFAYFFEAMQQMVPVLLATASAMILLLWVYFRSLQGVMIPVFSGVMSAVWGFGFAGLCGFNLDPLVLVVPVLITARALSHSVQSMERYHEEYHRLGDKRAAIIKSYTELFPPAMVSIICDGLAIFTIAVASIPIMQKLAFVSSFWVISIFLSVVTLHPIILSYVRPPDAEPNLRRTLANCIGVGAILAAAVLWGLFGHPAADFARLVAFGPWLKPATVTALLSLVAVGVFFVAGGIAERWLAGVAESGVRLGLRITKGAGIALAVAAVVVLNRRGLLLTTWLLEAWVLYSAFAMVVFGFLWWYFGLSAERVYSGVCGALVWLSRGAVRHVVVLGAVMLLALGYYLASKLKVGDTTPGAALLYQSHPYNVAFNKVNEKFVGASQLVIIAEGKEPEAIKRASTLEQLDLFGRYMEQGEGAGGSLTATTLLKKVFRTFHEGDPKWEILPARDDHVGQLFFLLTSSTRRGEMDRFFDMNYTNATVSVFYRDYDNAVIHDSIARAKHYIEEQTATEDSPVRYRLAGGLLGVLAAVNEEVDWSYEVNISLILLVVLVSSAATYWGARGALWLTLLGGGAFVWWQLEWLESLTEGLPLLSLFLAPITRLRALAPEWNVLLLAFVAYLALNWRSVASAIIVMVPSLVAQPLSEGVMYLTGIDFNINSLPVAAVGIGIGIDYGYYVLSRIKEEYAIDGDYDEANRRALETTGRAVLFTGSTLTASVVFWMFFPMKFQAQMAMLLAMLLLFHVVGALVVIPAMVSLLRPRFELATPQERAAITAAPPVRQAASG
jgi:hypothetical protein